MWNIPITITTPTGNNLKISRYNGFKRVVFSSLTNILLLAKNSKRSPNFVLTWYPDIQFSSVSYII